MADGSEDPGWLESARRLDNRVFGPATTNNFLINALMLVVRRWTAPLWGFVAGSSLLAAPIQAATGHSSSALDSLGRALFFLVLAVVSYAAWRRWGRTR